MDVIARLRERMEYYHAGPAFDIERSDLTLLLDVAEAARASRQAFRAFWDDGGMDAELAALDAATDALDAALARLEATDA